MDIWNSKTNSVNEALKLPKGSYAGDFGGMYIEQSVSPHHVVEAAYKLKEVNKEYNAVSQAQVMYLAQKDGLAFTDWVADIVLI